MTVTESRLIKEFTETYGVRPSYLITVPGRVNLVGEHTDYNGFPVLPIAIPQTILVACAPRNDRVVHIKNIDNQYSKGHFEIAETIPRSRAGRWDNYVKASAQTLVSHFRTTYNGMDALFWGTIPGSAGLASSSALVVASALALLSVNKLHIEPLALAELLAEGEHYVGTQGGGMDQTICLVGRKHDAVKIDFYPLQVEYVPFLHDYTIVIAHSLVKASKTELALSLYNLRPAECRLATAIINIICRPDPPITRLGDLRKDEKFKQKLLHPLDFVKEIFTRTLYSLDDCAELIGIKPDEVKEKYLYTNQGNPMTLPTDGFLLRQRVLHILSESNRVEESCEALRNHNPNKFGLLMDASHESCDSNYCISIPELNSLVAIMRNCGALGARLTGAGFGGCAVALVRDEDVESLLSDIRNLYYHDAVQLHQRQGDYKFNSDQVLFAVKPSAGAEVIAL